MTKKPLTAGEIVEIFSKFDPNDVVAASDYFGGGHDLYHPSVTHCKAGTLCKLPVDDGGEFVDENNQFIENTIYIGHQPYDEE